MVSSLWYSLANHNSLGFQYCIENKTVTPFIKIVPIINLPKAGLYEQAEINEVYQVRRLMSSASLLLVFRVFQCIQLSRQKLEHFVITFQQTSYQACITLGLL